MAQGQKIWRVVVPNTREFEISPRRFAACIGEQTGEDSGLQVRSNNLWTKFVHSQEDRLRESQTGVRLAEVTGLQTQVVKLEESDRKSERYVFDYNSMFNSEGKKLSPVDCVFPNFVYKKGCPSFAKGCQVHT